MPDSNGVVGRIPQHLSQTSVAAAESVEFLRERIDHFIIRFRPTRDHNRILTKLFKFVSLFLSAVLTILIGFRSIQNPIWIGNYTLFVPLPLSAFLTSIVAWEAFSDYKWKWVRYRSTLHSLYNLRDNLNFAKAKSGMLSTDEVDAFYQQLMQIVDETEQAWLSQRSHLAALKGNKSRSG